MVKRTGSGSREIIDQDNESVPFLFPTIKYLRLQQMAPTPIHQDGGYIKRIR